MISKTRISENSGFISISIACNDSNGVAVDPDSTALVYIYSIDSGSYIELDDSPFVMNQIDNHIGWVGCILDTTSLGIGAGIYECFIEVSIDGNSGCATETFVITADEIDSNIVQVNGNFVNSVDDFKADISNLAIEANVEGHVTNSLNSYDPPTRTELTTDKNEIINEINSIDLSDSTSVINSNIVEVNGIPVSDIDDFKSDISALAIEANVESHITNSLNSYDSPTRTELTSDKDEIISEIQNIDLSDSTSVINSNVVEINGNPVNNIDEFKADVSGLAIEGNIEGHITNSLNSYDPPTRSELTTDKDEIISEIQNIDLSDSTNSISANIIEVNGIPVIIDDFRTDVSNLAIEGNVENHVTNSLNTYDPSTRAENVVDRDQILTALNNVEATVDSTAIINANIVQVQGTPITDINDFHTDLSTVPNLVWNALLTSHNTNGSFSQAIKRTLGLSFENFEITNCVYVGGILQSGRINIYTDNTMGVLLAGYNILATYTNGNLTGFQIVSV